MPSLLWIHVLRIMSTQATRALAKMPDTMGLFLLLSKQVKYVVVFVFLNKFYSDSPKQPKRNNHKEH